MDLNVFIEFENELTHLWLTHLEISFKFHHQALPTRSLRL